MLNGRDIREYSCQEYRKAIAVVFQDYDMVPFSVKENINISTEPELSDPTVEEALETVGMQKKLLLYRRKKGLMHTADSMNRESIFREEKNRKLLLQGRFTKMRR